MRSGDEDECDVLVLVLLLLKGRNMKKKCVNEKKTENGRSEVVPTFVIIVPLLQFF